jgi:uncharacterized LabA/DUF88 family protein
MAKQKVIVYVDGFNFYFGLKAGGQEWKKFYWLDVIKFFEKMMHPNQELVEVNYFSAIPYENGAAARQDLFFKANLLNPKFKLTLGKYLKKEIVCRNCNYKIRTYEEKETDVRVATKMMEDVFFNRCDVTIVVSADSDMVPSIEIIKKFAPTHPVYVYFPPMHNSVTLKNKSDYALKLFNYKVRFRQSMLPELITLQNGYNIQRPINWR